MKCHERARDIRCECSQPLRSHNSANGPPELRIAAVVDARDEEWISSPVARGR